MPVRDVIIVGAGPSGLATAIAAKHFGLDYVVLEQGALVDAIVRFPINMVFFTTPELLEIGGLPLTTPYDKPTRAEALQYYRKVVDTFQLQVSLFETGRPSIQPPEPRPAEPFAVESRTARGVTRVREARNVVLAMGYYTQPNMLNIPGEDLPHVTHFYKEAHPYYRQRVVIVGGKNSAAEAALEIHRAGGHVTMVHRGAGVRRLGEVLGEARHREPRQGRLDRRALQRATSSRFGRARSCSIRARRCRPKHVLLLTGYRADPEFMRRIGVTIDPETLEPKLQRGDLRDQRARSVRRRRPAGREEDGHRVHRERPVPRRGDREDAGIRT